MKIIENIKRNSGLSSLRKSLKAVKRNKFVYNLVTARKVGIIGVVNNVNEFDEIIKLQRYLNELNQKVEILAYYPGKEIPQQLLLRQGINIFNRNEVNWYGKPQLPFVEIFCRKEFDILIDLSMIESFPTRWISSMSIARFKVGGLSYAGNPYDLIISIDSSKGISYLIEQIKYYLNLLNNRFAQEQADLMDTISEEQEETI